MPSVFLIQCLYIHLSIQGKQEPKDPGSGLGCGVCVSVWGRGGGQCIRQLCSTL